MVWGIQLALFRRLMMEWACRVSEGINSCEAEGTPGGESPILPVIMLLIHPHCTWGNIPLVSMIYRK